MKRFFPSPLAALLLSPRPACGLPEDEDTASQAPAADPQPQEPETPPEPTPEELAAQQSRQVLEGNAQACEAMKRQARGHLEQAADLIVGRVGKN